MSTIFLEFCKKTRLDVSCKKFILTQSKAFCSNKPSSNVTDSNQTESKNEKKETDNTEPFHYPLPKIQIPEYHKNLRQIWKEDVLQAVKYFKDRKNNTLHRFTLPSELEFIIFDAGPIGTAIAYWIRMLVGNVATVLVIDKDLSLNPFNRNCEPAQLAAKLSVGTLRQTYTLKENVALAKFGADFLRQIDNKFLLDEEYPSIAFKPFGYLTLANKKTDSILKDVYIKSSELGCYNEILTTYQLNERFPWMKTSDLSLALHGLQNEGWFDPWQYLIMLRSLAMQCGVLFVEAEPLEFVFAEENQYDMYGFAPGMYHPTNDIVLKLSNGSVRKLQFSTCILAMGENTCKFAKEFFYIDKRYSGLHNYEIPVKPRKRYIYTFEAPEGGPGMASPLVVDPTGLYFRREGLLNHFICSCPPLPDEEPDTDNLDVDPDYFPNRVWPLLAERVPIFEKLNLLSSWARYEEYNEYDGIPFVGRHPAYHNLYVAVGFGDDSLQQAPGIGRAFAEQFAFGDYKTIDLNCFSFYRILQDIRLYEKSQL